MGNITLPITLKKTAKKSFISINANKLVKLYNNKKRLIQTKHNIDLQIIVEEKI